MLLGFIAATGRCGLLL